MSTRKIAILLIRYPGTMANFMGILTGFPYTHTTIGLEEDPNTFYSFVYKGFIIEKITRYLKPERPPFPCALYEVNVTECAYQQIKELLRDYEKRKATLCYTRTSLVLSLFHIPYKRKNFYFCSHFVAEVLQRSNAVVLKKNSVLCQPKDFHNLKEAHRIFEGDLQGMVDQFELTNYV